jgi:hypothetical protein
LATSIPIPTRSAAPAPRVPEATEAAIFGISHDAKAKSSIDIRVGKIWVMGRSAVYPFIVAIQLAEIVLKTPSIR